MAVLVLQHADVQQLDLSAWTNGLHTTLKQTDQAIRWQVDDNFVLDECRQNWLQQNRADAALLPHDVAFADLGMIVSDMDSTLITIECIDEIAAGNGLKDQVSQITERSMRGELDFAASLTERVALLKGLPERELAYVYDNIMQLNRGAEELLAQCRRHDVKFVLVSGGFTFFTERLQKQLGLTAAHANQLEIIDGMLTGRLTGRLIDAQAKANLLHHYADLWHIDIARTVAMVVGANDIPMIEAAGFGVAIHAKPKTRRHADICIDFGGLDSVYRCFAD